MNRLQYETSPYLRQHAANPVDWYPWGEEALQLAREEDRPILLSIGYSACHWCHVMAHESFEDAETARLMNALFVNIKVDREERPDLDSIYMQAVMAMADGHGGWPLTVFLTPDGRPFYGGTYFPPEPRYGMPSFRQVLEGVADAYAHNRDQVEQVGSNLQRALDRTLFSPTVEERLKEALLDEAFARLGQQFDWHNGGFGGAPKFPQPMNLEFLLRVYASTGAGSALEMVRRTLDRMARGGIYDQIGGGFARYSVDESWLVPHFEKMLYDNAQLSRLYLHAWQITGEPFYRRISEEIYDYILREMTSPEGGFYSATDADSEGEEGRYFLWTLAEIEAVLGPEDARIAAEYWDITPEGNFEGRSILYVPREESVVATALGLSVDALRERLVAIRAALYAARSGRVPPGLDDKILTAWNGLMLASLAEGARVLGRADYRAAAVRSADFLLGTMLTEEGRLRRTFSGGEARLNGYLEDYACLLDGLLEVYQTTFDERYFLAAQQLAERALVRFPAADGGYFDTSDDHEALLVRPRSLQDNAAPSGQAMLCRGLLRLTAYTGNPRYEEAARGALNLLAGVMAEVPAAFSESLSAVDMLLHGLAEVAIIGNPAEEATQALLKTVQEPFRPNAIVALSPGDAGPETAVPLLRERTLLDGRPAVYVCRNFTCARPVSAPEEVAELLAAPAAR